MLIESGLKLRSYCEGAWFEAVGSFADIPSAVDGRIVARVSTAGLDFGASVRYACSVGGPALRAFTFVERAGMLKALARYLDARKAELYDVSFDTGATQRDHYIDIDGGIGTLFSYASKGRRDLPNERYVLDGPVEALGKHGTFAGRHILTPLDGVALHINAYNFPCWGMLEKLAPGVTRGGARDREASHRNVVRCVCRIRADRPNPGYCRRVPCSW